MPLSAFLAPALPLHTRKTHPVLVTKRRPTAVKLARRRRAPLAAAGPNWYEELSVEQDATPAEIKRAYRRAALKNHPDVSSAPDASDRFMRVQEAYAVLSDSSKRAAYDRQVRFDGWTGGASSNPSPGFDGAQYARQWRERNPMPEDLGDNFSSIFSDIFSGVRSAVDSESGGIVEDFVEFLEKGVGVGARDDDGLQDILKSRDVGVLECEEEDAVFLQQQLKVRGEKLADQIASAGKRAVDWERRAGAADRQRDYWTRDAARDSEKEVRKEVRRLETRARKVGDMLKGQEERVRKIRGRLEEVRREARNGGGKGRGNDGGVSSVKDGGKKAIDDELDRMKREMGL